MKLHTLRRWLPYIWACHRLPERSFFYKGVQFPICSRCTGLWIGYAMGIAIALVYVAPIWLGVVMLAPTVIDGLTQYLGFRMSSNSLRFSSGILGGVGTIALAIHFISIALYLGYQYGERFTT